MKKAKDDQQKLDVFENWMGDTQLESIKIRMKSAREEIEKRRL